VPKVTVMKHDPHPTQPCLFRSGRGLDRAWPLRRRLLSLWSASTSLTTTSVWPVLGDSEVITK